MSAPLGVGIVGVGWVAVEHLRAFLNNPRVRVAALCTRNEARARERLAGAAVQVPGARFVRRYSDLLAADDIDIISIATPNHLHAAQAVAAARAGKHFLLEKPTALDLAELRQIRDAVRRAGVRTIVSFELHYNPYVRLARWLRAEGWLGRIRFARFQYLSRVTDWYSGWSWVRTKKSGRSHLLAAGCHAVDALRWCSGLEVSEVSAYHTHYTAGYQWPTSIVVNLRLTGGTARGGPPLAQVTSSTDFQMPYAFGVELMGDRATLRDDLLLWNEHPLDLERLQNACPWKEVRFVPHVTPTGAPAVRIETEMPGSADVGAHPFQGEIDELVDCVLEGRETHLNVFDAQKTMEVCIAADRSAANGGRPVRLPLIRERR
ncbi:MAG TPA: Gfo/Idh/MocA family oxidoreductase [Vicinamibacterales bacterium]|nr:Gfo/Idh/MocA family oxidoreductase [Vicinamibacterales bacterium]